MHHTHKAEGSSPPAPTNQGIALIRWAAISEPQKGREEIMHKANLFSISIAISALILSVLACGSTNSGVQVATIQVNSSSSAQYQTYNIGDVVQIRDQTIVMNSAAVEGGILRANFTIENKGNTSTTISSLLSFEAKDSDGSKLEQEIFDCGSSSLDGDILPGDKLKGDICWKATTAAPFKIYYQANVFSSGAIVWIVGQ